MASTTSAARIEANRRNAQLSTGPRTAEGKERSRRNSFKHGMTGRGIVVPDEDAAEIAARFEEFEADLRPRGGVARYLVGQAAMLSVRVERCQRQEAARISEKYRNAPQAFDDARMAEVERLMDQIARSPATNARRLRQSPEGVDRLLAALRGLVADLARDFWGYGQLQKLENLMGRRPEDYPISEAGRLHKVANGDKGYLLAGECPNLDDSRILLWARDELASFILLEIEALEHARATMDLDGIALDRSEASTRALFDTSQEAILARRYEAAADRNFQKILQRLRTIEAETDEPTEPEPAEALGSSGAIDGEAPESDDALEREEVEPWDRPGDDRSGGREGGVNRIVAGPESRCG